MSRFARRYGASPVHLLVHLVALPLVGWVLLQVVQLRTAGNIAAWFLGALVLHDLVLLPAYSLVDRVAQRARVRGVTVVNHLRAPAVASAVTLLAFSPLILGKSDPGLRNASGVEPEGYLGRWLALVAAMWLLSALVLAVRLLRADDLHGAAGAADRDRAA